MNNLVDLLDQAGLTGRGGAAFSTATKVRAAHDNSADLIVNVCDGEPGAAKDAWIVQRHLSELVQGAQLVVSGRAGAVRYAAHRGSRTESSLQAAGLSVLSVPRRYVSSEETSLISLAHGGLARPMAKRSLYFTGGRDTAGRRIAPTVVLNAETVWRIAQVADRGADWFRSFGTADEPGPRLITVTGHVPTPVVVQGQAGLTMESLLELAGGLAGEVQTILIGGLPGSFVCVDDLEGLRWTGRDLAPFSASLGPGLIEVIDPALCPLADVGRRLAYAQGESAGQCGPCMFGLPALAAEWQGLVAHPTTAAYDAVARRAGLLPDRGACRFPDGVANLVRSALRVHDVHLHEHAQGSCSRLVTTGGRHVAAH